MDDAAWEALEEDITALLEEHGLGDLEDAEHAIRRFVDRLMTMFEESNEDRESDTDSDW